MSTIKIRGVIKRVLFDGENKVGLVVKDHNGLREYKVLGPAMMEVDEGKRIEADCTLKKDPKWGDQYLAELIMEDIPKNTEGILSYLTYHAARVGPGAADKIREYFKDKAAKIILETPDRLKEAGLTEKQIESIKNVLSGSAVYKDLWASLSPFGVGPSVIGKVYDNHGSDSLKVVRERPYSLCDIRGIGFKIADSIARANGIENDNPARLRAATLYIMDDVVGQRGDTAIELNELIGEVTRLAGLKDYAPVSAAIKDLESDGSLVSREIEGKTLLSFAGYAYKEKAIAKHLKRLLENPVADPEAAKHAVALLREITPQDRDLDPFQKKALEEAFAHNVLIITGGPGCGKTTISQCIVKTLKKAAKVVLLSAPTGKAAQRMSEVTGMESDTMHGTLKPTSGAGMENDGFSFEFNVTNKLKADSITLDEASMGDTNIVYDFVSAIEDGTKLIIIGDFNQIPSVGPGMVLRDLIKSKTIPVVQLKNVQRTAQGNDIPVVADQIIKGNSRKIDFESTRNVKFIESDDESICIAKLKTDYAESIKQFGVAEVQVLSPRKGTGLGVVELNEQMREIANPLKRNMKTLKTAKTVYRVGDRVIRNSPDKPNDVANGEVGTIVDIDEKNKTATVQFRHRVIYSKEVMSSDVSLGFVLTKHKSQGSEYKKVYMIISKSHVFMLNRNLIYTALTRGKSDICMIGSKSAFHMGVAKLGSNRVTGLKHELLQVLKPIYGLDEDPDEQFEKEVRLNPDIKSARDPLGDTFIKRRRKVS